MYPYLNHHTTNTKHNAKSNFGDVPSDIVLYLQGLLDKGNELPIGDLPYTCHIIEQTQAFALFAINNKDGQTIVRFGVCLKSRYAKKVWQWVDETSDPPLNYAPFLVVCLVTDNITVGDMPYLPLFADFERCLAWAWIDNNKIVN